MTLLELSVGYRASASALRERIGALRAQLPGVQDRDAAFALRRRIAELLPLLQEARQLAELTERYYDRSYHRHESYTL